jgi:CheY-like chemotaxis protein
MPVKGIAMSGYGMRADVEKSKAAGFAAHLIKPFGPAELDAAIRKVLAGASDVRVKAKTARP